MVGSSREISWKTWRLPGKPGELAGMNNKLNPHMTPGPGIEPRPHWWVASADTTASSLLPNFRSEGETSGKEAVFRDFQEKQRNTMIKPIQTLLYFVTKKRLTVFSKDTGKTFVCSYGFSRSAIHAVNQHGSNSSRLQVSSYQSYSGWTWNTSFVGTWLSGTYKPSKGPWASKATQL